MNDNPSHQDPKASTSQESVDDRTEHHQDPKDDPEHPFHWSPRKKWIVTLSTCFVCFIVGINATAPAGAATPINERFAVTDETFPNSFWPVTTWTFGAAIIPLVVLPVMEDYGVRTGYFLSYAMFFVFVMAQAVARNFGAFTICRFFAGGAAGVLQNCVDGVIADIWQGPEQRSLPITIYITALLTGVTFGPVFGGVISHYLYWRWIFYIQLIMYGVTFLLVIATVKETRFEIIKSKRSEASKDDDNSSDQSSDSKKSLFSLASFLHDTVALPAYLLLTEPVIFSFTLLSSLSYGIVFISTQSVAQVFREAYDFEEYRIGLVQLSLVIGELLGFAACLLQNAYYKRVTTKESDKSETDLSEHRLYLSVPAAFIGLTGGLFWYGWTSYPALPWFLPAIGLAFVGFGVNVVVQAITMYVTDAYAAYASSAIAAVVFGENIFAAFLPLAAQSMYTNLGFQWASSVLGFIALVLSFAPIVLIWKGPSIRKHSKFMRKAAL